MTDRPAASDALVLFGLTGDLAHKMIFPPSTRWSSGVSSPFRWSAWLPDRGVWRSCARGSLTASRSPAPRWRSARSVASCPSSSTCPGTTQPGDLRGAQEGVGEVATARALSRDPSRALRDGDSRIGAAGLADHARVIVEKPFGRDLASARESTPSRGGIPRGRDLPDRSFLGKEAIMNILYFRFANSFLNRSGIAITSPVSRSPLLRSSA